MDVDSSMSTDSDHDPTTSAATNNHSPSVEAASSPPTPAAASAAPPAQVSTQPQAPVIAGPRPAPTYTVVNAIIEKKEDGPGSRCGHTLTSVAAVGEEGTPGYIGPRLILFGGATALEGNSAAPPSSAGSAGIRKLTPQ